MSALAIEQKHAQLLRDGLDLGPLAGPQLDAGSGGLVQPYARGRIYYHPNTGAHEVHGAIMDEYLRLGGPGPQPGAQGRLFGFPRFDETRTPDDAAQISEFEWGAVCWGFGTVAVPVYGPFFPAWKSYRLQLGFPLDAPVRRPSGAWILFCQFGCLFTAGTDAIHDLPYVGPRFGLPAVAMPDRLDLLAFNTVLPTTAWEWLETHDRDMLATMWTGRLVLRPVAAPGIPAASAPQPVPLRVGRTGLRPINNGTDQAVEFHMTLAAVGAMADRTLYDLALATPGRAPAAMAPHILYAKSDWSRFGAMHATDIHVTERADRYHRRLQELGLADSAAEYNNYNDAFRDTIAYANKLHAMGALDCLLITGDLVDYQYEEWQDPSQGWGNFLYFERILLGQVASPGSRPVEALRVPIFTTLGNHDYRQTAYNLFFEADLPFWFSHEQSEFGSHNLTKADARALQGVETLKVSPDRALDMVRKVGVPEFYQARMDRSAVAPGFSSHLVALGPHRVVMLDSGHDLGVPEGKWDAFKANAGFGDPDDLSFVNGTPNQAGVTDAHLTLLQRALHEAGDGVVLVGIHGPPLALPGAHFVDFLRETVHPSTDPRDVAGHLMGKPQVPLDQGFPAGGMTTEAYWAATLAGARREFPGWMNSIGRPWFMQGAVSDALDHDVSKGRANELLQMCAGNGVGGLAVDRPADLVLCGHGHNAVEYRLQWTGQNLRFFMDFYSGNPAQYYGTTRPSWDFGAKRIGVDVVPGASPNDAPHDNAQDRRWDGQE